MKKLFFALMAILLVGLSGCGKKISSAYYDQPSKVIGSDADGVYVLRVQVRSRNGVTAFEDAQRKAVEEAIFKGFLPGSNGMTKLDPLMYEVNGREKNEDYFNAFFQDKGPWQEFVSLKDKRTNSTHFTRTNTQMVQDVTVTLNRAALKLRLQQDGVIPAANKWTM